MSLLSVENLRYEVNGKCILKNISFSVDKPKLVAVLGPNGSGKSHLLKSMCGVTPLQGDANVAINGYRVEQYSAFELSQLISWLPQFPVESFDYSVEEVLQIGLYGRVVACSDVEVVIRKFGLGGLRARAFSTLSGGEKRLCYVARTVLRDCKILLLDEPEAHLDVAYKLKIMQRLASLRGKLVVAALHDVNLALEFADEIWFMNDGALAYQYTNAIEGERLDIDKVEDVFSSSIEVIRHRGKFRIFFGEKV